MPERDARGVQKHALQAAARKLLVQFEIAVLVVAGNRKAEVRKVHPDLVRAAGLEFRPQEAVVLPCALQFKHRVRFLSFVLDRDAAFARSEQIFMQIEAHDLLLVAPFAFDQHEVILFDLPFA